MFFLQMCKCTLELAVALAEFYLHKSIECNGIVFNLKLLLSSILAKSCISLEFKVIIIVTFCNSVLILSQCVNIPYR